MANANPFGGISAVNPFAALNPTPQQPIQTNFGIIPAGFPLVGDLFSSLFECQWRGIGFPVISLEQDFVQRHAAHEFADRDSAFIESMGRAPLRFSARVPLLNYISRGKNETWPERQLYPGVWRALFKACADRTSGTFQHPELGKLTCKCENHRTTWSSDVQGGVFVSISWVETDDSGSDVANALAQPSPAASVFATAQALDAALANVSPIIVPTPYVPPISFTDLANAVRGVVDQGTLLQKEVAGRIDNLIYEANALEASMAAADNALNWPMFQMAEELKASAYELSTQLLTTGTKVIALYTVLKDSTLAQVANGLGAPIDDIVSLNVTYVAIGIVPKDTVIRYYAST